MQIAYFCLCFDDDKSESCLRGFCIIFSSSLLCVTQQFIFEVLNMLRLPDDDTWYNGLLPPSLAAPRFCIHHSSKLIVMLLSILQGCSHQWFFAHIVTIIRSRKKIGAVYVKFTANFCSFSQVAPILLFRDRISFQGRWSPFEPRRLPLSK
jgi:hypothetical protein